MQQVGAKAFAAAIAVDPARLPAIIAPPRRRAGLGFGRIWVLHRPRLLQALAAVICCAAIAGVYGVRDHIVSGANGLYRLGEQKLATSQFAISQISISGQAMTTEKDVVAALGITPETSMFNFDADAARAAIEQLPAVAEATVRKSYPNHLFVTIKERQPVARWRLDGVTYVIDPAGVKIGDDGEQYPELPLVVGDEAGDDAMGIIKAMDQFQPLKQGLVALSRIGDRRWDMIYKSGLRVQLPEQGVAQALAQLTTLEAKFQLLERDVTLVDLRVPGIVAVKPSDQAVAQLAAIAKANMAKNKVNFKQDADYSAPAGH
ncbi:MAG: FtsQ-type POTRA domain-containing protein [Devosia sp.]|nr:FtsQ-type POTRA domain-containing protein [Devosia sp.]